MPDGISGAVEFFPQLARLVSDPRLGEDPLRRLTLLAEIARSHGADVTLGDLGDVPAVVEAALGNPLRRPALAFRRIALDAALEPATADELVVAQRLGPFLEDGVLPVWIDVLAPAAQLALHVAGEAAPMLTISTAQPLDLPGPGTPFAIEVNDAILHIRLDCFGIAGTEPRYVALPVAAVALSTGDTPAINNAGSTRRLDFTDLPASRIIANPAATPVPPGDNLGIQGEPPGRLELVWQGDRRFTLSEGGFRIPDRVAIDFAGTESAVLVGERLVFTAEPAKTEIDLADLPSPYAQIDGAGRVVTGGWSLPVVRLGPSNAVRTLDREPAWILDLKGEIQSVWTMAGAISQQHDGAQLLVSQGAFRLTLAPAQHPGDGNLPYRLWRSGGKPVSFPVLVDKAAPVIVASEAEDGPTLRFAGAAQPHLGRPLDAIGRPIPLPAVPLSLTLGDDPGFPLVTMTVAGAMLAPFEPTPLVIENAFLLVAAAGLTLVRGRTSAADSTLLDDGILVTRLGITSWVPTLPDPYVSNLSLGRGFLPRQDLLEIRARLTWAQDEPILAFDGELGPLSASIAAAGSGQPSPAPNREGRVDWGRLFDEDSILAAGEPAGRARDLRTKLLEDQRKQVEERFGQHEPVPPLLRLSGPALLDVSTNRHLVGILLSSRHERGEERPGERFFEGASGAPAEFALAGLAAHTRLDQVEVVALPQIQWEPVFTLEKDQNPGVGWFPPALGSPHDGGPTRIASDSPRLVPSLPEIALDAAVRAFADEAASLAVGTTLPFGIAAGFVLASRETPDRRADTAVLVAPSFSTRPALEGGLQLSLRAEGGLMRPEIESPSFAGFAWQTPNGVVLATGATTGLSVLSSTADPAGSVESFFNLNFSGPRPRAPLTRLDLSGYGASTFSDWNDPLASFGEAAKVQFTVLVGRTSYEFVKIVSKLYPWGITVTRSVTIERRGGGGVLRRDSGWQASSSGLFDFRYKAPGAAPGDPPVTPAYVIEPGLIEGLFNVDRIRPARPGPAGEVALPGGKVVAMLFDADVSIAGRAELAPGRGILGFLHVEPLGEPLPPEALLRLVEIHRAVGGPIDAVFDLGGSGLLVRGLGIEMAVAGSGTGARLAGAVRVVPALPSIGAWAVVRGPAVGDAEMTGAPQAVPVIRTGVVQLPQDGRVVIAGPRGPFRFADPADLHAASPAADYGFLQSTPTHRFLFRRPVIEPGSTAITSALPPALVDIIAATQSKSLFPRLADVIIFPDAAYRLQIVSGATPGLRLDPAYDATGPRGDMVLHDEPGARSRIDYSDVRLAFTLTETRWDLRLEGLRMRCDALGMTDAVAATLEIDGATDRRPSLQEMRVRLFQPFEDLMSVLPGFAGRPPLGPVALASSNLDMGVKVAAVIKDDIDFTAGIVEGELEVKGKLFVEIEAADVTGSEIAGAAVGSLLAGPFVGATTAVVSSGIDKATIGFGAYVAGHLKFHISQAPPLFIIVGADAGMGFKLALDFTGSSVKPKPGMSWELTVFVGFGIGKNIICFVAEAWLAVGFRIQGEPPDVALGGVLLFEAKLDLQIAKVEIAAEFACLRGTRGGRQVAIYSGELSISVKLFWILSIEATAEMQEEDGIGP